MKSSPFDYHRPESLAEALSLFAEWGEEARALAGGQSLVPMLAMRLARPAVVVDLARIPELRGVARTAGGWRIGTMTREVELERVAGLPPIIAAAISHIGHFQIRTQGTVGGSLVHLDPAGEWPALSMLLEATLELASSRGSRRLSAREFALAPMLAALEPDELLVAVELPDCGGPFGFEEVERRPGDFALVGAACHGASVVAFGTGRVPQRLTGCEAHMAAGGGSGLELRKLAEDEMEAHGDIHASAAYRRQVGARLVERVVGAAAAA
ncbi:MAG: FAD binding domain-containing protein [Candidatus Dormibacteraeota bacterium]|uniref:FAD binding domain-containing protein n=1 Tax=Candidatus Dormiibacter inghamiae TaxID=3127013 RepID=A0A934NF84_9BACT|nr:FAD binding domain-containing protein [Candidatus Dormibacteraeota bacterium]MBJ7605134.1 FAD binding domain-containing protein [Candidatus Dormibacteraeota bacterium]